VTLVLIQILIFKARSRVLQLLKILIHFLKSLQLVRGARAGAILRNWTCQTLAEFWEASSGESSGEALQVLPANFLVAIKISFINALVLGKALQTD
jgi:hypothetical protein